MIGVCIGVGEYQPLARRAAASMSARTGLRCIVLSDEHYRRAGFTNAPPHLLKLRVWEFVTDEHVLLFDADTICRRDWDPAGWATAGRLCAVRDWIWRDAIRQEAADSGVPPEEYFLSCLMILNKTRHAEMLALAERLYPTMSRKLYEQTALNAARRQLDLPLQFLDRRYCWSRFGAGNLHHDAGVIVGHYNDEDLRNQWETSCTTTADGAVDEQAFSRLGNKFYRYSRIGHDERPIRLRDDGTIGEGGGAAERFWFVRDGGSRRLVIGGEDNVTCELTPDDDAVWRGAWSDYERMPIELMVHRGQVIADLVARRGGPLSGAELGVFEGQTSRLLLQLLPNLRLWMVDPWVIPQPGERYFDDPYMRLVSPEQMEEALRHARTRTDFARDRRIIVMADQVAAARCVPDHSLDFVFVDSDHSREGTLEAIDIWWRKLRPGALMIGHDLDYPGFPGVREAVEEAACSKSVSWNSAEDYVWWFSVPV